MISSSCLAFDDHLGIEAPDLLAELRDAALQKILLAVACIRSRLELRLLRHQQILDRTLFQPCRHFGRNFEPGQAVALGDQPGDPRPDFVELLAHHLQAGLRLGRVEPHQQIAVRHPHAVADGDLAPRLRRSDAGWS